jgi:hypothetical protein
VLLACVIEIHVLSVANLPEQAWIQTEAWGKSLRLFKPGLAHDHILACRHHLEVFSGLPTGLSDLLYDFFGYINLKLPLFAFFIDEHVGVVATVGCERLLVVVLPPLIIFGLLGFPETFGFEICS